MKRFLENYRLSENVEVLVMIGLGMVLQVVDGSPFTLKERWLMVWNTEFPTDFFSPLAQIVVQSVLALIVVLRCLLTYAYISTGLLVCWTLLTDARPIFIFPYLLVSGFKSVCLTFLETLTGLYVCSNFRRIRGPCVEFFIAKAVEMMFAVYLWGSVMAIYKDMYTFYEKNSPEHLIQMALKKADVRRRRARSLVDESTLQKTARLNYFEFKDVPKILMDMLTNEQNTSRDSLIGSGMMLASVSNMGSFDNLKISQSLGELGALDLRMTEVIGLEETVRHISLKERAMKFMKLTPDDIAKAQKRSKETPKRTVLEVDEATWDKVRTANRVIPNWKRREQVYIREIPPIDLDREQQTRRNEMWQRLRSVDMKSFKSLEEAKLEDEREEEQEEQVAATEADYVLPDKFSKRMFMSNIKEEGQVNRIHIKNMPETGIKFYKGNKYATLYRRESMSMIQPEVYEKSKTHKQIMFPQNFDVDVEEDKRPYSVPAKLPASSKMTEQGPSSDVPGTSFRAPDSAPLGHRVIVFRQPADRIPVVSDQKSARLKTKEIPSKDVEPSVTDPRKTGRDLRPTESREDLSKVKSPDEGFNRIKHEDEQEEEVLRAEDLQVDESHERRIKVTTVKKKNNHENRKTERVKIRYQSEGEMKDKKSYEDNDPVTKKVNDQVYFVTELLNQPFPDIWKTLCQLHGDAKRSDSRGSRKKKDAESDVNNKITWKSKVFEKLMSAKSVRLGSPYQKPRRSPRMKNRSSFEKVEIGLPRSKKLKTHFGDDLQPLILFGNEESGWSTCPVSPEKSSFYDAKTFQDNGTQCQVEMEMEAATKSIVIEKVVMTYEEKTEHPIYLNSETQTDEAEELAPKRRVRNSFYSTFPTERDILEQDMVNVVESPEQKEEPEGTGSVHSLESEESFSLYYSKAADLASPLFDTKRFIYPDHIHYSYKNMNTKGFDVDITNTGGLPLLIRESLTLSPSLNGKKIPNPPDAERGVTRKPMDLTFAGVSSRASSNHSSLGSSVSDGCRKKTKTAKKSSKGQSTNKTDKKTPSTQERMMNLFNELVKLYSRNEYHLLGKLLKIRNQKNKENAPDKAAVHCDKVYVKNKKDVNISSPVKKVKSDRRDEKPKELEKQSKIFRINLHDSPKR